MLLLLFRSIPLLLLFSLTPMLLPADTEDEQERPPISGRITPHLRSLDRLMLDVLREHNIPGASLAVAKDGRLVFAHGYGWAAVGNKMPVAPATRFNLASCSKPITAAAVLKLVDRGKLRLDDKVFVMLRDIKPPPGAKIDPRIREITVRQVLHHAGGLVREAGPLSQIARCLKVELPITVTQATAYSLHKPLLFDPGTESEYSNLGFLVLRLVVERASGQDYETFAADRVLKPMGIRNAHLDRMEGYWPIEAHRYPGGRFHRGGHGELKGGGYWVLSTVDAMRFLTSLDGRSGTRILSPRAYRQMLAPLPSLGKEANERHLQVYAQMLAPLPSLGEKATERYIGLGWDMVQRSPDSVLFSKGGHVAGTYTWIEHLPNGVCWAAFFNGDFRRVRDGKERSRKPAREWPWPLIREAIQKIDRWPTHDLFPA